MRERTATAAPAKGVGVELLQLIDQIGREKGIDLDILVSALEDAITTASRKAQERGAAKSRGQEVLISRLDRTTGEIRVMARKRILETVADDAVEITLDAARCVDPGAELGGYVDLPRSTMGLGRIEAQAAKQVISQKVREAERENVYNEYAPRVGELVNASVKRFERGDVILDLGRIEGCLPRRFLSRTELFAAGDRVRAIVVEVSKYAKGPQVIVSRTDPTLLVKLFEMEVPEIHDGTVTLRQAVREAGERAKVAVSSRQRDIDPVGACVGMKGSRVQAIIRELRGEKIDIVPWAEELPAFAANALNPAKVARVLPRPAPERGLEAIVDGTQLSLAIGKKGQNVRLASKLVGCRIDIVSEEEQRRAAEQHLTTLARRATTLAEVPALASDEGLPTLAASGIHTVGDLLDLAEERLSSGALERGRVEEMRERARAWLVSPSAPAQEPAPDENPEAGA